MQPPYTCPCFITILPFFIVSRLTACCNWSPGSPDFWLPQRIMISHWLGHMITWLHDYPNWQTFPPFISCYYFSNSVPGLCRLLKFGSMMARRDQQGMLTTTLYNFGADVCHTNLAAFVKSQSKGCLLLLNSFISYNRTLWVRLIRV